MKTSKCLSLAQVDPCPECGAARVGRDYDDDYYVGPGVLRRGCGHRGPTHRNEQSHLWQPVYHLAVADAEEPCPQCGGLMAARIGRCTNWTAEVYTECVDFVEDVAGCDKCCEHHAWPG